MVFQNGSTSLHSGHSVDYVELLEHLASQSEGTIDPAVARRALREAALVWPGHELDRWWKWVIEAGTSVGLRVKVIDATVFDALEIVSRGVPLATCLVDETHGWLMVTRARGRKFQIVESSQPDEPRWLTRNELLRMFERAEQTGPARWVVAEQVSYDVQTDFDPQHGDPRHGTPPLARFRSLLRPEMPDVWVVTVFALFVGLLMLATPIAVETLVNTVAFGRFLQPIIVLAVMMLAFLMFQAAMTALQTYVVEIIQRRLYARVAADLAWRLPRVRQDALDRAYGPELVNRFYDVVTVQKVTAQFLLECITLVLGTVIGMAVLAFYHPWLLGFDVVLLGLLLLLVFGLGRGAVYNTIKASKQKYLLGGWLEELARCPVTFKIDGAPEFAAERADRFTTDYLKYRGQRFRILMRQIIFALGIFVLASTALLGLGGWLVIQGQLTLGQLVAAEMIVAVVVGSFAKAGKHLESYYDVMASVDKLGVLFDLPIERQDGLLYIQDEAPARVRFRNVSYQYPGGKSVLSGIGLTVEPGERLGLTGPPACGKSTLLDLLYRLRVPTAGHIELDNLDPRDIRPDVLRRHVSLVRSIEVFDGTVAQNVHLERVDVSAADVRDALRRVDLLEEVLALPDGLDTQLYGHGSPLTKSQARRLMLARAIAGRPRLLLIDGLLDSLPDSVVDRLLPELFEQLDCTILIASGRDSILERCTRRLDLSSDGRLRDTEMSETAV